MAAQFLEYFITSGKRKKSNVTSEINLCQTHAPTETLTPSLTPPTRRPFSLALTFYSLCDGKQKNALLRRCLGKYIVKKRKSCKVSSNAGATRRRTFPPARPLRSFSLAPARKMIKFLFSFIKFTEQTRKLKCSAINHISPVLLLSAGKWCLVSTKRSM